MPNFLSGIGQRPKHYLATFIINTIEENQVTDFYVKYFERPEIQI